jgi:GH24 family phage-related lysozyme (muramidase)
MLDRKAALEIVIPFLRARESLQPSAYWDNGDWSIGYGHRGAKEGDRISDETAEALLLVDADSFAGYIQPHLPDQNPNQFAALISLSFNIGLGQKDVKDGFLIQKTGEKSTILTLLQAGAAPLVIGNEFLHWIYEGHIPISGLCTRRTLERRLYLSPYTSPGVSVLASDSTDSLSGAGA